MAVTHSDEIKKAMLETLMKHDPVLPIDKPLAVMFGDKVVLEVGSSWETLSAAPHTGTITGFDIATREFVYSDSTRVLSNSVMGRALPKSQPRRFVHRDQSRYPGLSWEIDEQGRCWVIDADGTRARDEAASPWDYLNKTPKWWDEVYIEAPKLEAPQRTPIATGQDIPQTVNEDAW